MNRHGGIMSSRRSIEGGTGLDYDLSKLIAQKLSLEFKVKWFEGEHEEETDPVKETYAMLAYGLCDVVPSFTLYATAINAFSNERGALPRLSDQPKQPLEERDEYVAPTIYVDLKPISHTVPYIRSEMGIVVHPLAKNKKFSSIADMEGLKVGIEQGTLNGALTSQQGTKRMISEAITVNPGPTFLWKMEEREFDAALVAVSAYDLHKRQNHISKLELTDYRHPIGFNIAFAGLKSNQVVIDQINQIIIDLQKTGKIAEIAKKNGVHYAVPKKPDIQGRLTLSTLQTVR